MALLIFPLAAQIPALKGRVYGEEEAHFSAPDKEYRVDIKPTECRDSTFRMLSLALNGNDEAGRRLADVVHRHVGQLCRLMDATCA